MVKKNLFATLSVYFLILATPALAECMAIGFREGEEPKNPIYTIQSCAAAEDIVDHFRLSNPDWYGDIPFAEDDVAIKVTFANEDAKKLLPWNDSEYWYYSGSCSAFEEGQLIVMSEVKLEKLCCDLGPVRSVQCGLGGTRLIEY